MMTKHGVKKLIFPSTAPVHGEPAKVPISEEHAKLPINPYGDSRLAVERILKDVAARATLQ
jgi:UDP-glucose 4-epimerase